MSVIDILQLVGGAILAVGYIPQIVKLLRTKSSADFNPKSFLAATLGVALMEPYGIKIALDGNLMFIITNTTCLVVQGAMAFLILWYKRKNK